MKRIDQNKEGFSIIVPVYQEAKNIPILIKRISDIICSETTFEVLLMDDDSRDGTVEIVAELKKYYPWVKLIVRSGDRSWAKSVIEGIQFANFPILIFMDADLSHPPESILQMLTLLTQSDTEMVIGSRYMHGGAIDKEWPFYRNIISRLAAWIIRPLLPLKIKDPLSGFIAIRKESYLANGKSWNPIGAKLGLEIIVKSHVKNIIEIPIYFGQRQFGSSKLMNMKMAFRYAEQVRQLWVYTLFGIFSRKGRGSC
jgi:dolichol-phosphate mannosyltransferase